MLMDTSARIFASHTFEIESSLYVDILYFAILAGDLRRGLAMKDLDEWPYCVEMACFMSERGRARQCPVVREEVRDAQDGWIGEN